MSSCKIYVLSAAVAFAALVGLAEQPRACGPDTQITTADYLEFQMGVIDRGLAREQKLTPAQREEITSLREVVQAAQKAEKRAEARAAMEKIVAMFSLKEMMGAVEPIVPGCATPAITMVSGTLLDITIEPNRPGTRCGNHYVLRVRAGGKVVKVNVYDLAKAPYDTLKPMLGKAVDVETLGSGVLGVRLSGEKRDTVAGLRGLSAVKPC